MGGSAYRQVDGAQVYGSAGGGASLEPEGCEATHPGVDQDEAIAMGGSTYRQVDGAQAYRSAGGGASLEPEGREVVYLGVESAGGRASLEPEGREATLAQATAAGSRRSGGCARALGWKGGVRPAGRGRYLPDCLGVSAPPGSDRGGDSAPWRAGWHADGVGAVCTLGKVVRGAAPSKGGRSCQASSDTAASSDRAASSDIAAVELPSRYWSATIR